MSFLDVIKSFLYENFIKENHIYLVFLFSTVIFIGLRYKMANDWYSYLGLIERIDPLTNVFKVDFDLNRSNEGIETGFLILVSIIKSFDLSNNDALQVLTLLIVVFSYISLVRFVKYVDEIPYKYLFLSIFVSLSMFREFDVLRQTIALYIFIYSIKYIGVSYLKYLGVVLFASFFHLSALIFIPLYFFFNMKVSKKLILSLFIIYSFTIVFKFSFVNFLIDRLSFLYPELTFLQRLYMNSVSREFAGGFVSFTSLIYLFLLVILYFSIDKFDYTNKKIGFFVNVFLIFIVVNIIFSDSKDIADRVSFYFFIGLAFVFVFIIQFLPAVLIAPYLIFLLTFPFLRFSRVIGDQETKSVLVPYRNYFFVTQDDEETILINWQNKNEK